MANAMQNGSMCVDLQEAMILLSLRMEKLKVSGNGNSCITVKAT